MAGRGRALKLERPRPLRSMSTPTCTGGVAESPIAISKFFEDPELIRPAGLQQYHHLPTETRQNQAPIPLAGRGRGKIQKPRPLRSMSDSDATRSNNVQTIQPSNLITSPSGKLSEHKVMYPSNVRNLPQEQPTKPMKSELDLKNEMRDCLTEIDMIQMNLPTYKWNHPEVRRMMQLVRTHGAAMQYHMPADVENLFDDFRDLVKSNDVNAAIRTELLELIEDRARGWTMDDDTKYYYVQKHKQIAAEKERFMTKKVKVVQADIIDMNSVIPVYEEDKIMLKYSFKFDIPMTMSPVLIGKQEDRIRLIESISGTRISLSREVCNGVKKISVFGPYEANILNCVYIINDTLKTNKTPSTEKYAHLGLHDYTPRDDIPPPTRTRRIEFGDGFYEQGDDNRARRHSDSSVKRDIYGGFPTKNVDTRSNGSSGFGDVDEELWETEPIRDEYNNHTDLNNSQHNNLSEWPSSVVTTKSALEEELSHVGLAELPANGVYSRAFLYKCFKSPFSLKSTPPGWESVLQSSCLSPIVRGPLNIAEQTKMIELNERLGCDARVVKQYLPEFRSPSKPFLFGKPFLPDDRKVTKLSTDLFSNTRQRTESEKESTDNEITNKICDIGGNNDRVSIEWPRKDSSNSSLSAVGVNSDNSAETTKNTNATLKSIIDTKSIADIALPDVFDGDLSIENLKIEDISLPASVDSELDESLPGEWDVEMEIKFHSTRINDIPLPSSGSSESDISPPPPQPPAKAPAPTKPPAPTKVPAPTRAPAPPPPSKFQPKMRPLLSIPLRPLIPFRPPIMQFPRFQNRWYAPYPPHPEELLRRRMMQPAFYPIGYAPIRKPIYHPPRFYY